MAIEDGSRVRTAGFSLDGIRVNTTGTVRSAYHDLDGRTSYVIVDLDDGREVRVHPEDVNPIDPEHALDRLAASEGDSAAATLADIARSFPSLRDALVNPHVVVPALRRRDDLLTALRAVSDNAMVGDGCRHAAAFVLGVYNNRTFPDFDMFAALGRWDDRHREAFAKWTANPRWV